MFFDKLVNLLHPHIYQVSHCKEDTHAGRTKMASYFDEHDCEPTNPEEQYRQNALLELARLGSAHVRHIVMFYTDWECTVL